MPETTGSTQSADPSSRYGVSGQFGSSEQKHHAATLGMWLFLSSELMLFGGMFLGYTVYRIFYGATFAQISNEMHLWLGTLNTAVLLSSSFTMALAVHSIKEGRDKVSRLFLMATASLGAVFLFIKGYEWSLEIHDHLLPMAGRPFAFDGANVGAAKIFMGFYFVMTGFHFVHLFVGVSMMLVLVSLMFRGTITAADPDKIEMAGLYWHLVDIIWVFLYPIFYLVGR